MKAIGRFAVSLVVATTVYLGGAVAADWPGYRGPHGSGISDEKDLPLPAGKESVLWKVKLPGPGASGPIAVGDRILVTCYTGYGTKVTGGMGKGGFGGFGKGGFGKPDPADLAAQKKLRLVLLCLDNKGETIWQKALEPKLPENTFGGMIREHGYATSTPACDGKRVYVFFGKTGVIAFDLDGQQRWQADVGSKLNFFGTAASPLLYEELVIINASIESGALIGLDGKSGKEVWRTRNIGQSWGSPVLVETEDQQQEVVLSLPGKVAGFDPRTGKELWHCKGIHTGGGLGGGGFAGGGKGGFGGGYGGTYSSPTAHNGIVYVSGGGGPAGPPTALAVRAGGKGDVDSTHVLWRQKAGTSYTSPVIRGEHVYFVDGSVTCLRADNGKVVYKERLYESRGEYVSPVAVGDKLVVLTRFEGLFVLSAGKDFEQLASFDFSGDRSIFNASPAVADGRLYARSNDFLYCLGKGK